MCGCDPLLGVWCDWHQPKEQVTLLTRMRDRLHVATGEDCEVVDDSVYVNYAASVAVVLTPDESRTRWDVCAMAWDRTGGVSREDELATAVHADLVPALVRAFIERENAAAMRLLAILEAGNPDI